MGGIIERVWSVAAGPNRSLILILDEGKNVVCKLGGRDSAAGAIPDDAQQTIDTVIAELFDEIGRDEPEAQRAIELSRPGERLSLLARSVGEIGAPEKRYVLRIDRRSSAEPDPATSVAVGSGASELAPQDAFLRQLAENIDAMFWMTDPGAYGFLYLSPRTEAVLGYTRAQLYENPDLWIHSVVSEDQEPVLAAMDAAFEKLNIEYRFRRPDGAIVWIHAKTFPVHDNDGTLVRVAGLATDITARKEAEIRLFDLAHRDPLTQALNRRGISRVLADLQKRRVDGSAILLDCDNFKDINDKFGHAAGDVVLRQMAERMQRTLRDQDSLGRVGGDEFIVVLPEASLAEAMDVAEKLRMSVTRTHLRMGDEQVSVSASFGITSIANEVIVDQLVHRAESGVRTSKRLGKNRVHATPSAHPFVRDIETIRASLLAGEGLRVASQRIRRIDTGEPVACELLARRDANDPLRDPSDFFAFAIEQNIITSVDLQCLRACLAAVPTLDPSLDVHLNLFPSTLLEVAPDAVPTVFGTRDLSRFHVEIVEEQFIADPEYLADAVRTLRGLGAHIVLDDVGFGQSSVEALVLLEPDGIKIDRRVVRGAGASSAKQRHLTRIFKIAQSVGAVAVAEGIENDDDLDCVRSIGIQFGQGYYWDVPK
ncbi:MAG: diguanylate cyclase [Myxococcales bacterium]|nr:diguanylate cyclase [Myxococcales bacterium]